MGYKAQELYRRCGYGRPTARPPEDRPHSPGTRETMPTEAVVVEDRRAAVRGGLRPRRVVTSLLALCVLGGGVPERLRALPDPDTGLRLAVEPVAPLTTDVFMRWLTSPVRVREMMR